MEQQDIAQEEINERIAADFFTILYHVKDLETAKKMMHSEFVNHPAHRGKDRSAYIDAINKQVFEKFPDFNVCIKRITTEADLVWIQSFEQHSPGEEHKMAIDIWRIQDGLIAEHWDNVDILHDIEVCQEYNC